MTAMCGSLLVFSYTTCLQRLPDQTPCSEKRVKGLWSILVVDNTLDTKGLDFGSLDNDQNASSILNEKMFKRKWAKRDVYDLCHPEEVLGVGCDQV